jgi:hypothetical protein
LGIAIADGELVEFAFTVVAGVTGATVGLERVEEEVVAPVLKTVAVVVPAGGTGGVLGCDWIVVFAELLLVNKLFCAFKAASCDGVTIAAGVGCGGGVGICSVIVTAGGGVLLLLLKSKGIRIIANMPNTTPPIIRCLSFVSKRFSPL